MLPGAGRDAFHGGRRHPAGVPRGVAKTHDATARVHDPIAVARRSGGDAGDPAEGPRGGPKIGGPPYGATAPEA